MHVTPRGWLEIKGTKEVQTTQSQQSLSIKRWTQKTSLDSATPLDIVLVNHLPDRNPATILFLCSFQKQQGSPRRFDAMGHGHSIELQPLNILAFCDWEHRGICTQLSPTLRSSLQQAEDGQGHSVSIEYNRTAYDFVLRQMNFQLFIGSAQRELELDAGYWHFLCERLAEEHDIYVPSSIRMEESGKTCPVAKDWRSLFLELYALKD